MHLLFSFLLVATVVFILWRQTSGGRQPGSVNAKSEATDDVFDRLAPFYISDGNLFGFSPQRQRTQVESQYVQEMKAREEKSKKLAGWKEGTTWDTSFAQMRGMGDAQGEASIQFSSLVTVGDDKLLYFLKGGGFGGLFEYCQKTQKEQRLLHRQNLDYQDLYRPNHRHQILCSAVQSGGSANIALMQTDGNGYQELTAGDTLDSGPAWVWDRPDHVVYQSQGLARDPEGYIKGVGPAEVILLDTTSGELSTVFSDEEMDYLKPQVSQGGYLYFIRRPYEATGHANANVVLDALLFPFRLLRAVFHYLNFFSLMYSRKPLTSAGGPQIKKDAKSLMIQGRKIDAEKALRQGIGPNGVPSLVPASWVLVRCDKNGSQEVLATHVASYYLRDDDNIVYTNGCGVFYITPQGEHRKILQDKLVESVVF